MIAWESYPITVMGREGSFQPQKKLGQDDEEQKPSWMTEEEWQEYLRKKRMKQDQEIQGIASGIVNYEPQGQGVQSSIGSAVQGILGGFNGGSFF
jgi:hypothetical protein